MSISKLSSTGEITSNFLLNDVAVYIQNTTGTGSYQSSGWKVLGYTSAEKSITPIMEQYRREDKIPRVVSYVKTIRKGLEVKFSLSNQSAELDAILMRGTLASLGSTGTEVKFGTDEPNVEYRAIRFSAKLDDGKTWTLTIPKAELSVDGDKTFGGETETVTPIMAKAIYNPLATENENLFYVQYLASGISATADVPPGYV